MSTILTKSEIEKLISGKPPLVEGLINLAEQLQPNGIDLTLKEIARLKSAGKITVDNRERVTSELEQLPFGASGFIHLSAGSYIVTFNKIVNLPVDRTALGKPRSSLLRCGANLGTAVWDAGYSGRSQSLLIVHNPLGFTIERKCYYANFYN